MRLAAAAATVPAADKLLGTIAHASPSNPLITGRLATYSGFQVTAPVGSIQVWLSERLPRGWLPCDHRWVNPAVWPELAELLAEDYGGHVPDMRARLPAAYALHPLANVPGERVAELPPLSDVTYIIKAVS